MTDTRIVVAGVLAAALMSGAYAEQGAPQTGTPQQTPGAGRGRGAGRGAGGAGIGSSEVAPLLFEERWTSLPNAQPITQEHLSNQHLRLHLYGDVAAIRKSNHEPEYYTYTGEARTNWALTVSDPANLWDLSRAGKVMLRTRNTGWRFTHVVIKTADGNYFASEEGSGESTSWMNVEYPLQDLHWRNLLMTDTPTNASNKRTPDPTLVPIIPTTKGTPDLARIDEVGFSDLMPGGWIPATTRVNAWAVYGKKVAR
jgi:hypothetical protein